MRTQGKSISGRHSLQCFVFASWSENHTEALGKRRQNPDRARHSRHRSWMVGGRMNITSLQRFASAGMQAWTRFILIWYVALESGNKSFSLMRASLETAAVQPPFGPWYSISTSSLDKRTPLPLGLRISNSALNTSCGSPKRLPVDQSIGSADRLGAIRCARLRRSKLTCGNLGVVGGQKARRSPTTTATLTTTMAFRHRITTQFPAGTSG